MATPSLPTEAPSLLWVGRTGQATGCFQVECDGVVLAGSQLALRAGSRIVMFNKEGERSEYPAAPSGLETSSLTGGADGNVYFAAATSVFSLDPNRRAGWYKTYGQSGAGRVPSLGPLVLSPDGVLYGVGSDDKLRAIRAKDGEEIWSRTVSSWYPSAARALGGAGKAIFLYSHAAGIAAYDTRTGAELGNLKVSEGHDFRGRLAGFSLGWKTGISFADTLMLDSCGKQRWSFAQGATKAISTGLIAPGELTIALGLETLGTSLPTPLPLISLYDAEGQKKAGPQPLEGQPFAVGGDGTLYAILCKPSAGPTSQLIAYGPDLGELWRLALGGYCASGHAVLDSDGVLYLVRADEEGQLDLLAIQTRSPGLADSSWPSWRHDNRGTSWLP